MNELKSLGKTIKYKRLALNLRMDDVARQADISRATLWAIEKGQGGYSISTLIKVLNILSLSFDITNGSKTTRDRASRENTARDKKINRFVIMCIEQYALCINENSDIVYKQMKERGIIKELVDDYDDLHGMSFAYLNDYIDSLLNGGVA